jgi:hypothetical protein
LNEGIKGMNKNDNISFGDINQNNFSNKRVGQTTGLSYHQSLRRENSISNNLELNDPNGERRSLLSTPGQSK